MDSPGSPLSELSSDDFQEEEHALLTHPLSDAEHDTESTRPNKRQRVTGPNGPVAWETNLPAAPPEESISSDTEGSVPGSPHLGATGGGDEDDYGGYGHREQISACKWDGCEAGDLGNMDLLVQHLHDEHIHARQKKYSCEWGDCNRKGIPHASGYALRAHMRSHTREKPFYCSLPECDRSFTRSDALAKHMRTVHETEALRPSDPVPKHHSSNPQNKSQRVRLTFKGLGVPAANGNGDIVPKVEAPKSIKSKASTPASPPPGLAIPPADLDYEHSNVVFLPPLIEGQEAVKQFPPDVHFTPEELAVPPRQLLDFLRRQLAERIEDGDDLRKGLEELDTRRKQEWLAKELVLENVMEGELATVERKAELTPLMAEDAAVLRVMKEDVRPALELRIQGEQMPWWREKRVNDSMEGVQSAGEDDSMVKMEQSGGRPLRDPEVLAEAGGT